MLRFLTGAVLGFIGCAIVFAALPQTDELIGRLRAIIAEGSNGPIFNRARAATGKHLIDPYSAKYEGLRLVETDIGRVVCGVVNAKNRMGGYVGRSAFVYQEIGDIAFFDSEDGPRMFFKARSAYCEPDYQRPARHAGDVQGKADRK